MSNFNDMSNASRYLVPLNDTVIIEDGSGNAGLLIYENETAVLTKGAIDIFCSACLVDAPPTIGELVKDSDVSQADLAYRFVSEQDGFVTVNESPILSGISTHEIKKGSVINVKGFGSVNLTEDADIIERTICTEGRTIGITHLRAKSITVPLLKIDTPILISTAALSEGKLPTLSPENRGGIGVAASCSACGGCGLCGGCTLCGEINFAAGAAFAAAVTFSVHLGLTAEVIRNQRLNAKYEDPSDPGDTPKPIAKKGRRK